MIGLPSLDHLRKSQPVDDHVPSSSYDRQDYERKPQQKEFYYHQRPSVAPVMPSSFERHDPTRYYPSKEKGVLEETREDTAAPVAKGLLACASYTGEFPKKSHRDPIVFAPPPPSSMSRPYPTQRGGYPHYQDKYSNDSPASPSSLRFSEHSEYDGSLRYAPSRSLSGQDHYFDHVKNEPVGSIYKRHYALSSSSTDSTNGQRPPPSSSCPYRGVPSPYNPSSSRRPSTHDSRHLSSRGVSSKLYEKKEELKDDGAGKEEEDTESGGGSGDFGDGNSNNGEMDTTSRLEKRKEQCRKNQAKYRLKRKAYETNLDSTVEELRNHVKELEQYASSLRNKILILQDPYAMIAQCLDLFSHDLKPTRSNSYGTGHHYTRKDFDFLSHHLEEKYWLFFQAMHPNSIRFNMHRGLESFLFHCKTFGAKFGNLLITNEKYQPIYVHSHVFSSHDHHYHQEKDTRREEKHLLKVNIQAIVIISNEKILENYLDRITGAGAGADVDVDITTKNTSSTDAGTNNQIYRFFASNKTSRWPACLIFEFDEDKKIIGIDFEIDFFHPLMELFKQDIKEVLPHLEHFFFLN